jgi:hypothetical protein
MSLRSDSGGIHSELHRLTLRFEINLLGHLHYAFKALTTETFIFNLPNYNIFT